MQYVTTIAISDRGNFHIALNDPDDLRPLCGAKPKQRTTAIQLIDFDHMQTWYCNRCYWLRATEGSWDGRA